MNSAWGPVRPQACCEPAGILASMMFEAMVLRVGGTLVEHH